MFLYYRTAGLLLSSHQASPHFSFRALKTCGMKCHLFAVIFACCSFIHFCPWVWSQISATRLCSLSCLVMHWPAKSEGRGLGKYSSGDRKMSHVRRWRNQRQTLVINDRAAVTLETAVQGSCRRLANQKVRKRLIQGLCGSHKYLISSAVTFQVENLPFQIF